jgi:hypothetical protein
MVVALEKRNVGGQINKGNPGFSESGWPRTAWKHFRKIGGDKPPNLFEWFTSRPWDRPEPRTSRTFTGIIWLATPPLLMPHVQAYEN